MQHKLVVSFNGLSGAEVTSRSRVLFSSIFLPQRALTATTWFKHISEDHLNFNENQTSTASVGSLREFTCIAVRWRRAAVFGGKWASDKTRLDAARPGQIMKTRLETLFVTCLLGWNCLAVHAQVATEAWVQLQGLAVNSPLIARDSGSGLFKLTMGIQKSTNLVDFVPFPMTAPQTSINATGQLEFQFASSNGAAFYRLESKQN